MQFENRPPDEGINAQPEHLGREAVWLIVGAIVCVVVLVVVADFGARWLAPRLPFSVERSLAERLEGESPKLSPEQLAANAALQGLADRLRGPLGMPDDITVQVRVDDSEVLNAYATVGGRIVIHRGLLRRLRVNAGGSPLHRRWGKRPACSVFRSCLRTLVKRYRPFFINDFCFHYQIRIQFDFIISCRSEVFIFPSEAKEFASESVGVRSWHPYFFCNFGIELSCIDIKSE